MPEVRRSATETLVSAMEDFGENEPKDCLIIYANEAGELVWSCTSNSYVIKLGLVESCREHLKIKMREL